MLGRRIDGRLFILNAPTADSRTTKGLFEGLFDGIELYRIAARLARLLVEVGRLPLSLDDSRETWLPAIRAIFESMDREQPA